MKFFFSLIIIFFISDKRIIFNFLLKKQNDLSQVQEILFETNKYSHLFKNNALDNVCSRFNITLKTIMYRIDDSSPLPRSKVNIYEKDHGKGKVGYIFDYLDDIFRKSVVDQFNTMWEEAKAIQDKTYKEIYDPYSKNYLIEQSKRLFKDEDDINLTSQQNKEIKLKKLMPKIDFEIFDLGIKVPTIQKIINSWGWRYKWKTDGFYRTLLDKYDFDGDGRLNVREFILFSIINNIEDYDVLTCKNCYSDVIKIIDEIFRGIDCSEDENVETEEICNGFQFLNRHTEDYDMFKCKFEGKFFHSSACNDLVLKNNIASPGLISLSEFRQGILLGYWDRHTDNKKIYDDEKLTNKKDRWPKPSEDYYCDTVRKLKKECE